MYFLWKRTPYGNIRISYEGLSRFIQRFLTPKLKFCSFALAEGDTASVTLVLTSDDASQESRAESRLISLLEPLGMAASVVWSDLGGSTGAWVEKRAVFFYRNPWVWMMFVSAIALFFIAGAKGLFWTSFWGVLAWFLVKGLTSFLGRPRFLDGKSDERR